MADASARHPDHQAPHVSTGASFAIPPLGGLVNQLIKGRVDVIGELDLGHGFHALRRASNGEPHDALLAQWGIKNSLRPEFCGQVHAAAEHAAKGDIFAEDEHALVATQRVRERAVHGLEEVLPRGHGAFGKGEGCLQGGGGVVEERMGVVFYGQIETGVGRVGGV